MHHRFYRQLMVFVLSVAFFSMGIISAHATLGEKEDSVEADRALMTGTKRILNARVAGPTTQASPYTVHEIVNSGITLREYVGANGVIFGIAWKGINHPDLAALLGSYAAEFQDASAKAVKRRGHRAHNVVSANRVIVERSGHMRALQGRAYVSGLLPEGVSVDEIR